MQRTLAVETWWEPSQAAWVTTTSNIPDLASHRVNAMHELLAEASVASRSRRGRPRPH